MIGRITGNKRQQSGSLPGLEGSYLHSRGGNEEQVCRWERRSGDGNTLETTDEQEGESDTQALTIS